MYLYNYGMTLDLTTVVADQLNLPADMEARLATASGVHQCHADPLSLIEGATQIDMT